MVISGLVRLLLLFVLPLLLLLLQPEFQCNRENRTVNTPRQRLKGTMYRYKQGTVETVEEGDSAGAVRDRWMGQMHESRALKVEFSLNPRQRKAAEGF